MSLKCWVNNELSWWGDLAQLTLHLCLVAAELVVGRTIGSLAAGNGSCIERFDCWTIGWA